MGHRTALAMALCLVFVGGACNAAASSSAGGGSRGGGSRGGGSQSNTPRRDTFHGSIAKSTGAYSGDSGHAHIYLHPRGSGQVRTVHVVVQGADCGGASNCLDLNGSLTGTLSRSSQQTPDTGDAYSLTGSGLLAPLGSVTGAGSVHGTGFIARGRETLRITLSNSSGSVTLNAESPTVKGFTSP